MAALTSGAVTRAVRWGRAAPSRERAAIFLELLAAQGRPLPDEPGGALGELSVDDLSARNRHARPVLTVADVEVRRWMVAEEHPHNDALEDADR